MKSAFLIAACTAAVCLAPAALADAPTAYVTYNSADLTTQDGQDRIKARIARKAEQVCHAPNRMTLRERQEHNACVEDAIAEGEAQLERQIAAQLATQRANAR